MEEGEARYLRGRLERELAIARSSACPAASGAHLALARLYAERLGVSWTPAVVADAPPADPPPVVERFDGALMDALVATGFVPASAVVRCV